MSNVYIGNRGGIPTVTTTPTSGTSSVLITLPNHIFRYAGCKGIFIINLTTTVPQTTASAPIQIQTNSMTLPLDNETGAGIVASDMASVLTFTVFFDKANNVLRVISPIQ